MERVYRFWSLDSVYRKVVELVEEKGALLDSNDMHLRMGLFEGDVYQFGLAPGRKYPEGSMIMFPKISGKEEKPTASFPAILGIYTESLERLVELEKKYGLDKMPKERRQALHPDQVWTA